MTCAGHHALGIDCNGSGGVVYTLQLQACHAGLQDWHGSLNMVMLCCIGGCADGHSAASVVTSTAVAPANTTAKCVLMALAYNNKTVWACSDIPTTASAAATGPVDKALPSNWQTARVCKVAIAKGNSVTDTLSRLWGLEEVDGAINARWLCAFRSENGSSLQYPGMVPLSWNTTDACAEPPSSNNSMPDAQGR